jgi:hypothetical protein
MEPFVNSAVPIRLKAQLNLQKRWCTNMSDMYELADYRVDFLRWYDPRIDPAPRPSTTVESRATIVLPAADLVASQKTQRGCEGTETPNKAPTVAAGPIIDNRLE